MIAVLERFDVIRNRFAVDVFAVDTNFEWNYTIYQAGIGIIIISVIIRFNK